LTALTTASDSLTAGVTAWPGRAIDADPPGGFRTLVRRNDHALVAVSESSPRQVWVNLDLREWSRTTDFVVFFGNVFESFRGGSGDQFVSSSPVSLGREWKRVDDGPAPSGVCPGLWPGLYRSDDGRLLAINAPVGAPAAVGKPAGDVPRPDPSRAIHGGVSLTPVVCWMALSAIVAAVFLLPRRNEPSTK
jgi:hypothetical protein